MIAVWRWIYVATMGSCIVYWCNTFTDWPNFSSGLMAAFAINWLLDMMKEILAARGEGR